MDNINEDITYLGLALWGA